MKGRVKRFFISSLALAIVAFGALLAVGGGWQAYEQASAASGVGSVTEYATSGGNPWGTTFDSSGRVWVAMPGCDLAPSCPSSTPPGKLGLFDPGSHSWVTTVSLPKGYGQPLFVAVDQNGKVWFTMPVTNAIGRYDPSTKGVSQWAVPTASSGPWDLTIDSKGTIWFTEHYGNKIGSYNPGTNSFKEIATTATNSNPYGITVDASDNIWFTENVDTVAQIAKYSTQGVLSEYKIRNTSTGGTGLTPHLITIDQNGNIWWSEGWVHAIGKLDPTVAQPGTNKGVTEYSYTPSCSSCGSHTSGIKADKQGLIWLDDSLQNTFGSFSIGGGAFSFTNTAGHPHDGLNVDAQNRIWFDEEFANKIAVAIPSSVSAAMTPTSTSNSATATPTPTPSSPTPTPAPGATLGQDTFQRANQSLWGKASDGQSWGGDANSNNTFSISNKSGHVSNTGSSSYSAVLGASASNAEVTMSGSISAFSNSNFGAVLRWTDGNNWYKAYVDGSNLTIQKKVNGTTTVIKSVPFTATAGTSYSIHFRVTGSTLTANVWASSASEPSGWMVSATDSSLTSGYCGLRVLTQSGTLTVTSFVAKSL
jgi:hypothetical protein